MNCPNCNAEDLERDEVDVGVGVIYGPYGCHACGWSEDERYDSSNGPAPADGPDYAADQWGGLTPRGRRADG